MPISASAKKSLRSSQNKKEQNKEIRIALKKAIKNVNEKNISDVFSQIDKAVKINLFHHNKANRLKSNLAKQFKNINFAPKSTKSKTQVIKAAKLKKASKTTQSPVKEKKEPTKKSTKKTVKKS